MSFGTSIRLAKGYALGEYHFSRCNLGEGLREFSVGVGFGDL